MQDNGNASYLFFARATFQILAASSFVRTKAGLSVYERKNHAPFSNEKDNHH
jgi:hypothetical protein